MSDQETAVSRSGPPDGVEVRPQFPVLDSLRAIGALAVLTTHTAFQSGDYLRHGVFGTVLARLDVGVAIFFVLSGFLLSRPYVVRGALAMKPPRTGRYYLNRLLRIYPVYAVTVIIALLFIPDNEQPGLGQWVTSLLLLDSYTEPQLPHGLTHMWSIAAEVGFYVLLPGLMALAVGRAGLRTGRILGVLASMTLLSVVWHLYLDEVVDSSVTASSGIWLPAYLTWFAVGIGLAVAHVRLQAGSTHPILTALPRIGRMPGVCWTAVLGLMLIVATPIAGPTLFQVGTAGESLAKHLVYAAIGGLLVITGVWTSPGRYARWMSARLSRHLGHISYSVFCIHLSVITLVMWLTGYPLFQGHGLQIWLLTLAITLLASEVLYRLLELPFLRLKSGGRPRPTTTPSTADSASSTW